VILRINRAATAVKWSPGDNKFAVASGMKCISVCYYESENNWWISKHIKKEIKSTVLSVDWSPDSNLIAAGATDFKARIFCAAVKGVDKKPNPNGWGGKLAFGELIAEFDFGTSWVHDISFSPSGEKISFVSHDSSLVVVESSGNKHIIKTRDLPYCCVRFLGENTIACAGHDANVAIYEGRDGCVWAFTGNLDAAEKKDKKSEESSAGAARNKFAQADKLGAEGSQATELHTTHQNSIGKIVPAGEGKISTHGLDGKIVQWDLVKLSKSVGFKM